MSGDVITELFAFVALDDFDGNEGVMAFHDGNSDTWIPMIGADMTRINSLIPLAEEIEEATGAKFEIRHFSFTGTLKR